MDQAASYATVQGILTCQDVVSALEAIILRNLGEQEIHDACLLVWLLPQDVLQQQAVQQAHAILATGVSCYLCATTSFFSNSDQIHLLALG